MTRLATAAISVPCPSCAAAPGDVCRTLGFALGGVHRERIVEAQRETREANQEARRA